MMMVGATLTTKGDSEAQSDSSEVPFTACVAVALTTPVVRAETMVTVPLALPVPSVVTLVVPKYTRALPRPLASHTLA